MDVAEERSTEFESDVISDGTQTKIPKQMYLLMFESDVISDGTQTMDVAEEKPSQFESDVISDGTQTNGGILSISR